MAARQVSGLQRGDRVQLDEVPDDYRQYGLCPGHLGTVDFEDSLGTIHIRWDGGARCGITAQHHGLVRRKP
jgi:hypothetical protein